MEKDRRSPIGTRRDAAAALERFIADQPMYGTPTDSEAKNGIRYCGQGVSRAVYVDAQSRVVYKVDTYTAKNPECEEYDSNEDEYRNIRILRAEGVRWAPPAYLWSVDGRKVLAMPFYPTSGDEAPYEKKQQARDMEYGEWRGYLGDLHDGNWRLTKNGQIRVIDLA